MAVDVNDLVLLGLVSCAVSAIVCIIAAIIVFNLRSRDVEGLYAKVESIDMAQRGATGRNVRAEKAERMNSAMFEAMTMYKEGKPIQDILKEVGGKYPDVAIALASKFGGLKL